MSRRRAGSTVAALLVVLIAAWSQRSRQAKPHDPGFGSSADRGSRPIQTSAPGAAAAAGSTSASVAPAVPERADSSPAADAIPTAIPINQEHLFAGEINRRGKPAGFHSRPGGTDPESARVVRVLDGPNSAGVYTAEVEILDPRSGSWLRKTSTFYPDRMRRADVLQAILHAFESREGNSERFRGPSGAGFTIEGYFQSGRINTAYPIYSRR